LWRTQRTTIQPVFQAKRMATQAGMIAQEAGALVERLRAHEGGARSTSSPDDRPDASAFSAGHCWTGPERLHVDRPIVRAVQDQAMFRDGVAEGMVPTWLPLPKQLRFRRARRDLERVVARLVAERDANPTDGDDVLSR